MLPLLSINKGATRAVTNRNQIRGVVSSALEPLITAPKLEGVIEIPQKVEKSTLEGGVQLISLDLPSAVTTLSLYVKAGSRYETRQTSHSSLFLKHLAFKGTNEKSALRLVRDIEHIGASFHTQLNRDTLSYHLQALRPSEPNSSTLDILTETLRFVLNPLILEHEVETTRKIVLREAAAASSNFSLRIDETLHAEAFRDSGLANPLAPQENRTESVTPQEIHQFVKSSFYPGNRITIVGTGISHQTLLQHAQKLFTNVELKGKYRELRAFPPLAPDTPTPQSPAFVGSGLAIRTSEAGDSLVGLGFPGVGFAAGKDYFSLLVLLEALGGAHQGELYGRLLSRLNEEVVASHPFIKAVDSNHYTYHDAGLLVISATAAEGHGKDLVTALVTSIKKLADTINPAEVDLAKKKAKLNYSKATLADRFKTVESLATLGLTDTDVLAAIEAVSATDLKNVARRIFGVNPVVAAIGDVRGVPRLG